MREEFQKFGKMVAIALEAIGNSSTHYQFQVPNKLYLTLLFLYKKIRTTFHHFQFLYIFNCFNIASTLINYQYKKILIVSSIEGQLENYSQPSQLLETFTCSNWVSLDSGLILYINTYLMGNLLK